MANTTGKKFGGRKKGTPNKKSQDFADKYDELAEKHGDPVEILFEMIIDKEADRSVRRAAASDLLQYRFSKRKAVEVEITGEVVNKVISAEPLSTEQWEEQYGSAGNLEASAGSAESTH